MTRSRGSEIVRSLLGSRTFVVGSLILLGWIFDAVFWRAFVPHDPQALGAAILQPPGAKYWFGTDNLGRDVLSRTLAGASSVLAVAPAATGIGLALGIAIGLVTGYYRGIVDDIVMRIVDALLAFPLIVLAVLVFAMLGSSIWNLILLIGLIFAPFIARTVRSSVLVEREREYVAAARLLGERDIAIMVIEILPNIVGPILVEATTRLGYAIFVTATLSFLSLGIQQPSPDWGLTISLGRTYLQVAPWMALFPAAALATLIVGVNLTSEGVREVWKQ